MCYTNMPRRAQKKAKTGLAVDHVSHSLNSLKVGYIGANIGDYYRGY